MASERTEPAPPTIPVSVITGFLGSGKTTLLSRLLADPRMSKAAVIINEFGEVGLDHLLVTSPREDVVLLSSGCSRVLSVLDGMHSITLDLKYRASTWLRRRARLGASLLTPD